MTRRDTQYVCQSCGAAFPRWVGRCEACGSWNTIVEEALAPMGRTVARAGKGLALVGLAGEAVPAPRRVCGIAELDRVTGGGLVPGSAVLIGGDPGIGKSTLLLQAAAALARTARVAYISGEESVDQVRLRAARLGLVDAPVMLAAGTAMRDILATLDRPDGPEIAVIDSIQTMHYDGLDSAPGTVAQVRACAAELIRVAKRRGATVLLVGHVTKEGLIAGPKVLEHMVDTVLYFEGERGHHFRILRAVKNRFGAADEIGVFEMTDAGLAQVPNPSALFLADRHGEVSGAAVFAGMEGTRPLLVEIQALVGPPGLSTPRRTVVGWDGGRLAMVLAVLEARCGLSLAGSDVYLNVAGGLRIGEPAADLAAAAAVISSLTGRPTPKDTVVFGEIGLSGEVRTVGQAEARLKEAQKLGFRAGLVPARRGAAAPLRTGLALTEIAALADLIETLGPLPDAPSARRRAPMAGSI